MLAVAPVRQFTPHSSLLACIESLARDHDLGVTQTDLIRRFPWPCRLGHPEEGRVTLRDALEVIAEIGLSDSSETIIGPQGLNQLGDRIRQGVFLRVESEFGSDQWWRLAAVHPDGVEVMQPEADDPAQFGFIGWEELARLSVWSLAFDH